MDTPDKTYSIEGIEGDVLVHHGLFGWIRAREGMEFADNVQITIKTGKNGTAHIVNAYGQQFQVPPRSLSLLHGGSTGDDIDTLRFIRVSAREVKAARKWTRLATAL